jgi:ABC transporter substrate binding protein (PQQ-dependent alcohol dehydrogenase system)
MAAADWAAWAALKAVAQAVLRTRSADFAANRDFILGERFTLDGSKGSPMSFRPWDGQLRQPMLLATHDAVIERAPLRGFLHRTNDLDTLGDDQPESPCRR